VRSVLALAGLELRRFLADRLNLFFVLVLPLVIVVILGLQSSGGGSTARVALTGDAATVAALEAELATLDLSTTTHEDAEAVGDIVSQGAAVCSSAVTRWPSGRSRRTCSPRRG
jgi:ABC-2 type transport system permease protein